MARVTVSSSPSFATDNYISATEDDSTLTISGTSNGLSSGDTVTVKADGTGTDRTKTDAVDGSGNWSVTLSSSEVQGLDSSSPAAGGEIIVITATATGVPGGTAYVVYDPTAPSATVLSISGGAISGAEDDSSVPVVVETSGDTASMTFSISDSDSPAETLTKTGARDAVYTEKLSNAMTALTLADKR